jgi:hypothetical protein
VTEGLGRDARTIQNDPIADNVYTQAMMMACPEQQFPMQAAAYPLWEAGAPTQCRVGGEWNSDASAVREGVEHQIALGRNAAINAECENDPANHRGVAMAYALGQRFYTPYNYPLDKMNVAAADLDDVSRPFADPIYERLLQEERFDDDGWKSRVVSSASVTTKHIGNTTAVALCPTSAKTTGFVTYRIDHVPANGLAAELFGRANDFRGMDPAVQVRVLAGPSDDVAGMREKGIILLSPDLNAGHQFDLSDAVRAGEVLFVRIELIAPTLEPETLDWCAVWRVRFLAGWPNEFAPSTQKRSMSLMRKESLLVSWRADAELAMKPGGENARVLFDAAKYPAAYFAAVRR